MLTTRQLKLKNERGYCGTIYWDKSSKGSKHGRNVNHNCYRADIMINGVRHKFRSRDYKECEMYLIKMTAKIL